MERTIFDRLSHHLTARRTAAVVTALAGPRIGRQMLVVAGFGGEAVAGEVVGSLGDPELDRVAAAAAQAAIASATPRRIAAETAGDGEPATLFVDVYPPKPTLVLVGGVHVAIPLAAFARILGMRTVVVDPRTAFANRERFPDADEIRHEWPDAALAALGLDAACYVATLSHDDKLDVPALAAALRSSARYVGALGSRRTHAKRQAQLRALGFADADLERIHNPIGLPLGGRRAEEIAASILAEIVAVGHGTRDRL